jgi:hypothetical protein
VAHSIFVVIPKNVSVPIALIPFCKRFQIPIYRGQEVGQDMGWQVPGSKVGTAPCEAEHAATVNEKCFHRVVAIDFEGGFERCDNKKCGHVFRTFAPVKHICPEPDGICGEQCTQEVAA